MRAAIEALCLEHAQSPTHRHVTISLGVATAIPQTDELAQALVDMADAALYEAKNTGRNRFLAHTR
jgi:diguanylate cyclase (GGDEF)-like protein